MIKSGIKSTVKFVMSPFNKMGCSNTKRETRYSKFYEQSRRKKQYKFLTKVGTIRRNQKKIPRWACNQRFLTKFSTHWKQKYDPELILGKFNGKRQGTIQLWDIFDFKSKKTNKKLQSNFFSSHQMSEGKDPLDIRGSSANWESHNGTTERGFHHQKGLFADKTDSSRLKAKYNIGAYSKDKLKKNINFGADEEEMPLDNH